MGGGGREGRPSRRLAAAWTDEPVGNGGPTLLSLFLVCLQWPRGCGRGPCLVTPHRRTCYSTYSGLAGAAWFAASAWTGTGAGGSVRAGTLCRVGRAHHISFPRVLFVFMPNPSPVASVHDGCRHVTRPICTGDGLEKRRRCKYVSGLDDHPRRNGFPGRGGRHASCMPPLPPRPTGPTTCTAPCFIRRAATAPPLRAWGGVHQTGHRTGRSQRSASASGGLPPTPATRARRGGSACVRAQRALPQSVIPIWCWCRQLVGRGCACPLPAARGGEVGGLEGGVACASHIRRTVVGVGGGASLFLGVAGGLAASVGLWRAGGEVGGRFGGSGEVEEGGGGWRAC